MSKSDQFGPIRGVCPEAEIIPPMWLKELRPTHESGLATCGVPLGVMLPNSASPNTRVTERHHAHLAPC